MADIQIKSESLPQRCEICHQTDYYDPINNICLRCANVPIQEVNAPVIDQAQVRARLWKAENFTSKYGHIIIPIQFLTIAPLLYFTLKDGASGFIKSWYLSLIPLCFWAPITFSSVRKTIHVRRQLVDDTLRSSKDLNLLKQAINLNMMLAVLLMFLLIAHFALLKYLMSIGFIDGRTWLTHLLMFALTCGNFGIIHRKYDRSLKTLKVESNDPKILETYERWVKQWAEARFKLPD
jgi:hypothetical protein